MTGLTEAIGTYVASAPTAPPEDLLPLLRSAFIDTLGTMIAGRDEPAVALLREHLAERGASAAEASVLLGAERAHSADAALLNGTAAHALDYDDVALGGHPSTVLVPAILAEAQRIGANGARAMAAYLVGYEVWGELIAREPDPLHEKGWHPTAVFGTVGAAAALAALHGMDAARAAQAVALAGSMAGGLVANFGSMTKPLHAGRAAASAVEAVRLAARGFSASPDAMEHRAGFLAALSPKGRVDREAPATLGGALRIREVGLNVKRYPMCYATHRTIDGVLDLVSRHDLQPEEVASVEASIGETQAAMLRNHAPRTGLEAKFSLEFAVASAVVARNVGLGELTDGFVARPEVRAIFPKVRIATRDTRCPLEPAFAETDRVVLRTTKGEVLDSGEIRFPRGAALNPMEEAELHAKFADCTRGWNGGSALLDQLSRLETLPGLAALGGRA
ncbi:MmgE/PrpD family protein [Sabulicella glaciei]|uniref:MmgE/PrpD family protein n=1 Tax=Sabulicella glaciei TaxID=2984948 RepID=A0ABT3NY81_9PROT|nr:MmgE/PrpD family protein [Roseococcus sp. MDT2-1-1]MCW8086873.1 MmgE/PrpD family protein [Roseococcus sp. MDT2-1-1]